MSNPPEVSRNQLREFRKIVANAVGELRSQEIRDTYASITLSELLDQALKRLTDGDAGVPGRRKRLEAMYSNFKANLEAMKATPPEAFRRHDPNEDANTAP